MRVFLIFLLLILGGAAGTALYQYGTLDPCRMLAQELARDAYAPMADALGDDSEPPEMVERSARMVTSQYSAQKCASELADRWYARLQPAEE